MLLIHRSRASCKTSSLRSLETGFDTAFFISAFGCYAAKNCFFGTVICKVLKVTLLAMGVYTVPEPFRDW
jgi:hypothetical protein